MFKMIFWLTKIRIIFSVHWMSTYPNLNNDPELLRVKSKDDLKYETEEHYCENIIKSLNFDMEFYKKNL